MALLERCIHCDRVIVWGQCNMDRNCPLSLPTLPYPEYYFFKFPEIKPIRSFEIRSNKCN